MMPVIKRRGLAKLAVLDRSLEALPVFRLSDTTDDASISYTNNEGARWRVLASPGDRLPGTFDQDVYVEIMRRYHEENAPSDGALSFTLHAFLRSMGRQVDGRTYEQLRSSLSRLERTVLQSDGMYFNASAGAAVDVSFTLLSSVIIERRRLSERHQLALFPTVVAAEPGEARVVISAVVRQNIGARYVVSLDIQRYLSMASPVARRLFRLIEVARAGGAATWRESLEGLRDKLPLAQRYPSHLQRVLEPAHEMLKQCGVVRDAVIRQHEREWYVDYMLGERATRAS